MVQVWGIIAEAERADRFQKYCCCCLVAQSCPTLCDPMDCNPPLSMGILQVRIQEWVAISFSNA